MWNVKTKMTPVIIGATGIISKSFRKYLSSIPGKHDIKELQKTATLGTAHALREVLIHRCETFSMGNNITSAINCDYRIAAILYTRKRVFFRYII
jgi:hypothetical protein